MMRISANGEYVTRCRDRQTAVGLPRRNQVGCGRWIVTLESIRVLCQQRRVMMRSLGPKVQRCEAVAARFR